jgi:probable F420-dependent oxidoreductase
VTRIRVALQVMPQHATYASLRRMAMDAEELGADAVFVWDHFSPPLPSDPDPDGAHLECWSLLAAWAESTSRVELGSLVSCAAYRNPDLLADIARTVDHISGGRVILGLGAGWFERDFTDYGYEFGTASTRAAGLEDALGRVQRRLERLNPRPLRRPPLLVGGGSVRDILPLAAAHADVWHSFSDPQTLCDKGRRLASLVEQTGREPGAVQLGVSVGRNHPKREVADAAPTEIGPRFLEAGATWFTVGVDGRDGRLDQLKDWIRWAEAAA